MKTLLKALNVWLACFVVLAITLTAYMSHTDLVLGQRLGSGWFYLKGYFEKIQVVDGQTVKITVTENGIGMFIVPMLVASVLTGIWLVAKLARSRDSGT